MEKSERTALLTVNHARGDSATRETNNVWKNVPLLVTLCFSVVLKMTLETCLSSTATLTSFYFDWDARATGVYLALLGLLVLPANAVLTVLMAASCRRRRCEDRHVIRATLFVLMVGVWGVRQYDYWNINFSTYTVGHYITWSVVTLMAVHALEGPNMSLLSHSMVHNTSAAREGFWNVAWLATETGHLGRFAGDVLLVWLGSVGGVDGLLNRLFGALGCLVTLTWILACATFAQLEPPHDPDD